MNTKNTSFTLVLFFLAAVAIALLIPSRGLYLETFRVGELWRGETLMAPFDFPIQKTEAEMITDRREAESRYIPVYSYDTTVSRRHIRQVISDFNLSPRALDVGTVWEGLQTGVIDDQQACGITVERSLRHIYTQGVAANLNRSASGDGTPLTYIRVNKNAILSTRSTDETYTIATAKAYLQKALAPVAEQVASLRDRPVLEVDFDRYLTPNLVYDEALNAEIRDREMRNVAATKGIVHQNELIVSHKQVVDAETFSKLSSLRAEYETRLGGGDNYPWVLAGHFVCALILLTITLLFLYYFQPVFFGRKRNVIFLLLLYGMMIVLCSMMARSETLSVYLIPFAIVPIYLLTFYDIRFALFAQIVLLLLCSLMVAKPMEFFFVNFAAGVIGVFVLGRSYRRERIFMAAGAIFLSYIVLYAAMALIQYGTLAQINPWSLVWFGVNTLLFLGMYQLLYVIEKGFGFGSDISLLELCDTNQPLLLELAHKAPGTFQHSIQVANLAEAAAKEIGVNPLLVRTGALYHDIGKINNPNYFIENNTGTFNPHDDITLPESVDIIRKHVSDGVLLARRQGVPSMIVDFITGHHGDSLIYFFYATYRETHPDANEAQFRYPGPRSPSREVAVCMMADAVEAASRSLTNYTAEAVDELVDRIIDTQIRDNQFSDSDLAFRDVDRIKRVFKNKLTNIYHVRISYPERPE
ncbi:MAG: HDIG domain-containing protein [Rikenellaceae bacterium]|jgi:putative nucleotidyltransferase with HDIG domain|nr:HDIG domain-containing protein [Rikenellaceae bacterium]